MMQKGQGFPKVNSREAVQSPQGREDSDIKKGYKVGKGEHNYAKEG
jgi:hypothetical protein